MQERTKKKMISELGYLLLSRKRVGHLLNQQVPQKITDEGKTTDSNTEKRSRNRYRSTSPESYTVAQESGRRFHICMHVSISCTSSIPPKKLEKANKLYNTKKTKIILFMSFLYNNSISSISQDTVRFYRTKLSSSKEGGKYRYDNYYVKTGQ